MKTKFNEFVKFDLDVEGTINKIESHSESISIRKSRNYINNILIESELCKFYKEYNDFKGVKVKKLPVPQSIYDLEELFLRLDLELNKNINHSYNNMIYYLKEYLIYVSYFPHILEYRDKQWENLFNSKFIPYLYTLIEKDDMKDDVLVNQGYIQHHLDLSDSFEEIRVIKKLV